MIKIIQNEDFSTDEFKALVALLKKNDGIDYTLKKAEDYVEKAKEALSIFEASRIRDSLYDIADYALARRL
jgi:octaprenyl-diphosphate synthase